MTNLTEQWKKGKLPYDKSFYIKTDNCYYDIKGDLLNYTVCVNGEEISEVLAPLPLYQEYLALESDSLAKKEAEEIIAELEDRLKKTQELELEVRKENEKLKNKLAIAVEALKYYENKDNYDRHHQVVNGSNEWDSNVMIDCGNKAEKAIRQVKELDK